jgi:hypothetical protein
MDHLVTCIKSTTPYTLAERVNSVHTPVPAVLDDRLATRVGELPGRSYFQLKVKGRKFRT